jgi:predicted transporter
MAAQHQHDSDIGAAFTGLIGGAILIGAIMYGIVLWTNKKFESHSETTKASAAVVTAPVA